MKKKKVLVGMSGGVDSSVAAHLLLEQGYDVYGATMQIWQGESREEIEIEGGCCSLSAVDDARRVCDKLGIPYYVLNFREDFKTNVIDYFIKEYLEGRTPNPCIACNRYLKFELFLRKALAMGMDYIATGHYAKIEFDNVLNRYTLKKSVTDKKDQTYALYSMTQKQLKHTLMPVGDFEKDEIREIAKKLGLTRVANKPDSQEICFVPDGNYGKFIMESINRKIYHGNFVDTSGNILGRHKGIIYYTVGQRKGLGITFGKPMFVVGINFSKNEVILGASDEVFSDGLIAEDMNWITIDKIEKPIKIAAKIRYSAKEADAKIYAIENELVEVRFDIPQRAITPGQSVVFYDGDMVLGGGKIVKSTSL